jgi:hypothetical protein
MSYIKVPTVRQVTTTGLLGDIESRLTAAQFRVYTDSDKVTAAHEMTHGVCSILRNKLKVKNAFYIGRGNAFTTQASGVTLASLSQAIPSMNRGSSYQLYLIDQQQYWNDDAAYIAEELTCYLNGAAVGLEQKMNDRTKGSFQSACEFLYYCTVLYQLTNNDELKKYVRVCVRSTEGLSVILSKLNLFSEIALYFLNSAKIEIKSL